ncbi:MAG TPA: NAD(P)H-dependent oxidoreductase [Candidatus Udaeobacter sp.]|nr:NAD(P)H-dependent oxidoreductase [Candidatus Udaeobacter sp.]
MTNLDTVIDQLNWRGATKSFDTSKKVSDADFDKLMEAARLAPSSFGLQPWKVVVVKNPELRAKLRAAGYNQAQITDASHFVVFCSRTNFNEQDVEHFVKSIAEERGATLESLEEYKKMMVGSVKSRKLEDINEWCARQTYIMVGFLLEACAMVGIDACPMEGFDNAAFDEILGLKDKNLASRVMCAIGYRADDDWVSKVKKVRFPKEEVIIEM